MVKPLEKTVRAGAAAEDNALLMPTLVGQPRMLDQDLK